MTLRRIGLAAIIVIAAILAWAWIDGGREPLRPMSHQVELPESVQ